MAVEDKASLPRLVFTKAKEYGAAAVHRYKKFNLYQKVCTQSHMEASLIPGLQKLFVWGTFFLYLSLATAFLVIGPDRIGQTLYNFAQRISHFRFGWLILTSIFCECYFTPS